MGSDRRMLRQPESDPLFAMDDEDYENEVDGGQARRRKKYDKVPFTPEVSVVATRRGNRVSTNRPSSKL